MLNIIKFFMVTVPQFISYNLFKFNLKLNNFFKAIFNVFKNTKIGSFILFVIHFIWHTLPERMAKTRMEKFERELEQKLEEIKIARIKEDNEIVIEKTPPLRIEGFITTKEEMDKVFQSLNFVILNKLIREKTGFFVLFPHISKSLSERHIRNCFEQNILIHMQRNLFQSKSSICENDLVETKNFILDLIETKELKFVNLHNIVFETTPKNIALLEKCMNDYKRSVFTAVKIFEDILVHDICLSAYMEDIKNRKFMITYLNQYEEKLPRYGNQEWRKNIAWNNPLNNF